LLSPLNIVGQQQAWVGSTNGQFVPVTVNLLPYFSGQNLRYRFRLVTDSTGSAEGWYIDDVKVIIGRSCGTSTPTQLPTNTRTNTPTNTPTGTNTPVCQVSAAAIDVPKDIPDFSGTPGVVTSTITIGSMGAVSDVDVIGLVISHTWIGDLQISLTSPGGTTVLLADRACNAARAVDYNTIGFDDGAAQVVGAACPLAPGSTFRPVTALSAFNGQNASGAWTLTVTDNAGLDTGTLRAWGLRIGSLSPCNTATPTRTGSPTVTPPVTTSRTPGPTFTPISTVTRTATRTPSGLATSTLTATGTPTFTYTATGTPTPSPTITVTTTPVGSLLVGHVTWQGIPQPDSRNSGITATLSLCIGAAAQNFSVATDASGFFTVTTGLPDGAYNWSIKGVINLANAGTLSISGGTAAPEVGTMRAGDANSSDNVNIVDFNMVKGVFGTGPGQAGYDDRANFNRDGAINAVDFNLLKGSFSQAGNPLVCP